MQRRVVLIAMIVTVLVPPPANATHGGFDVLVDESLVPCVSPVPTPPIFAAIQDGVNAAAPGDRVGVCAGTYTEQVAVATAGLTVEGIGLVNVVGPAGPGPTFGFEVTADGVTIRRFNVSGFTGAESCGIRVNNADNAAIFNNDVHGNGVGICLLSTGGGRVKNNLAHNNTNAGGGGGNGIRVRFGADNEVGNNTVRANDGEGIIDEGAVASTIHHNLTAGNGGNGVFLNSSTNTVVANNTARDNGAHGVVAGPFTTGAIIQHNSTAANGESGLHVFTSSACVVYLNATALNEADGITMRDVSSCTIRRNVSNRNQRDGVAAIDLGPGNVFERNSAGHNSQFDCNWDGSDAPVFITNGCGTENPLGVW